ncbi:RsmB/NOP family class I SAM-dependent RNA methyltransferase [Celeribacter sp.]|uniref:RsmB/NOP family class I SAM-dependent RNA methyltransferase n=1 Tax=Celeribacter sp. TaxID=1890673 RepID=UPI003A8EC99F
MTPTARLSAAIELLDTVLSGVNAERALTNWARGNRYAGSKDRRAIRDYVFDALRCLRSYAWLGGAGEATPTGRQVMIGALRANGVDLDILFSGERFSPEPLTDAERDLPPLDGAPRGVRLDTPDWLLPMFDAALGADADAVLAKCRERSAVFLRVNRRKTTMEQAIEMLADDDIVAARHGLSEGALIVTEGARAVARSLAYLDGAVEVQDAGSQAIINTLPIEDGQSVLDYCAGGGGKALALACKADVSMTAHDIDPSRMQDIAPRSERAGVTIRTVGVAQLDDTYDLVVADVPCSGSGSWSRAPQAKWALTPERLTELTEIQAQILNEVAPRVAKGGVLGYMTCSLFEAENGDQITGFLARHPEFSVEVTRLITPLEGADGFFVCVLRKSA